MLKWLGKGLGLVAGKATPAAETVASVGGTVPAAGIASATAAEGAFESALAALLAPVAKRSAADHALVAALIRHVLHGNEPSALIDLDKHMTLRSQIGLVQMRVDECGPRRDAVYALFHAVPADVRRRWVDVLVAAKGNQNVYWILSLPNGIHWPEVLLLHAAGAALLGHANRPRASSLHALAFEAMFEAEGLPPSTLLRAVCSVDGRARWNDGYTASLVTALPDFADAVRRHAEALRPLFAGNADQRLHLLKMLEAVPEAVYATFAPQFAELAVSGSRQVRAAVQPFLAACRADAQPVLQATAKNGKPEARALALRALHGFATLNADTTLMAAIREMAGSDRAESVRALLGEWDGVPAAGIADDPIALPAQEIALPELSWSEPPTAETAAALAVLWSAIDAHIEQQNRWQREHHQLLLANGHAKPGSVPSQQPLATAADKQALLAALAGSAPPRHEPGKTPGGRYYRHVGDSLTAFATAPGVGDVTLLRTLHWFGQLGMAGPKRTLAPTLVQAVNAAHAARGTPSLLELSCRLEAMGLDGPALVIEAWCDSWSRLARSWPTAAIAPFFGRNVEAVQALLTSGQTRAYSFDRMAPYAAIASLPAPPARIVNTLFEVALGTTKADRPAAQEALARFPGRDARIIGALADGKADTRTVAAQWLGRLRLEGAIPALASALNKEKNDVAKGALLDALQAMGQPVEKYLDRDGLAAEAKKALAKGLPRELENFPWAALPMVRWNDGGAVVAPEVLRWMLVMAVRQKTPEPNAVLRQYCGMFVARDREAFGQFVLETWMAEDVRPVPVETATASARQQAAWLFQSMRQHPQHYLESPHKGKSEDELFAWYLPGCLRTPAGSAIGAKGLLAVAAACAAERAAPPVARYLKEWYGTRAGQGKALIAMLAWIEHPTATQLMLSIGHRFRTKGFQDEATRQAAALAERKGWTMAELADRTVPTAGFDEDGVLELGFGERTFTARLLPDFRIEIHNPDGRKIAALPDPRQDDDADAAANAKKDLASAKKQVKGIVELQTDRLHEALCTGRDWSAEDWSAYLHRHPVLRHLVQRLVWTATAADAPPQLFRPLADGTLSDSDDNPVQLPAGARVGLAHDSRLQPEQVAAWQQHLLDYEIRPLFQQFGKGGYRLPAASARATQINDFEGFLIEAFALRGRATKLDWTRGPTEDGGWFMTYEKRFPTLGLVAQIEFTGNPLPEENRTVALLALRFAASEGGHRLYPLADVPPVLLGECYDDLRLIAAEGSGHDPEWRKKSGY